MTLSCKPLWTEGMLMRPQHLQQYDRWIEHMVLERTASMVPFGWGLRELEIADEQLALGRIVLRKLKAVLPDGAVIDIPGQAPAPAPRSAPVGARGTLVHISLSLRPGDAPEVSAPEAQRRYGAIVQKVRDTTQPDRAPIELKVGQPVARLLFDGEADDEVLTMPIARIRDVSATGAILLDADYVPPCMDIQCAPRLSQIIDEVRSLLKVRGDALASGTDFAAGGSEAANLLDMMVLMLINGREQVFDHLAATKGLHPELLYRSLAQLSGELVTFSSSRRRERDYPAYNHLDVMAGLVPILDALRQQLAVVIERNTINLPLVDRGYGIRTAVISDRTIFQDCQFVLMAYSSLPSETIRGSFPASVKVGSVEQIRELVNLQLPGVPLRALPVAPRALPFIQNAVYFELDQGHEMWRGLVRSAAFAFHISGDFPDLQLEYWAIRGQRR